MAGISARGRRIALRPKLRPKLHHWRRNRHGTTQRKRFRPGLTPELMSFSHKKGPICDKLWLRGEWRPGEWQL